MKISPEAPFALLLKQHKTKEREKRNMQTHSDLIRAVQILDDSFVHFRIAQISLDLRLRPSSVRFVVGVVFR